MPRIVAYCGSNEGKKKNRQRGKALCVRMLLYFSKRGTKFPSRKKAVRTVCGQFCGQYRKRGYIFWCNPLISLEPARGFEPWTYWLRSLVFCLQIWSLKTLSYGNKICLFFIRAAILDQPLKSCPQIVDDFYREMFWHGITDNAERWRRTVMWA